MLVSRTPPGRRGEIHRCKGGTGWMGVVARAAGRSGLGYGLGGSVVLGGAMVADTRKESTVRPVVVEAQHSTRQASPQAKKPAAAAMHRGLTSARCVQLPLRKKHGAWTRWH